MGSGYRKVKLAIFASLLFVVSLGTAKAATLSLNPAGGTFTVGSTFSVGVMLNTGNDSVNALDAYISFPADKLQVTAPTAGQSIIGIWTAQPSFNNQTGIVHLQGGFPGGVNVSQGLVMNLSFRVKGIGDAIIRFTDGSRVLLNDGKGTDALKNTVSGYYSLALPPPEGPSVFGRTQPDQTKWYSDSNVVLDWKSPLPVDCYSYVLNSDPAENPDNICDGTGERVSYKGVPNGTNYFHIKSLKDNVWGGVSDFAVNIDTEPPAEFPIEVAPASRTSSQNPVINFSTTDQFSGLDHYEFKLVPLNVESQNPKLPDNFFIETQSPQVLSLNGYGDYDAIIRAYDKAANFTEVIQRLEIRPALLAFVSGKGMVISDQFVIPWPWTYLIFAIILGGLGYGAFRANFWHRQVAKKREEKELPSDIRKKLDELKKYRERYGKTLIILLALGGLLFSGARVSAQTDGAANQNIIAPPSVTTISKDISNEDIFYIGGKTDTANETVLIYLQNTQTGETTSYSVTSNKKDEWFYRHPSFLTAGDYLLWTQSKLGDQMSPPSPEVKMSVKPTAIQFGGSRISYETLYLILFLIFFFAACGLAGYGLYHFYHARKKHRLFQTEVKEAEETIQRGFAILHRDIAMELAAVRSKRSPSEEQKKREAQLLNDLAAIQAHIGKEVLDVEKIEKWT